MLPSMNIMTLLCHASALLRNSSSPRLDSELILADVLDVDRPMLYARADDRLERARFDQFRALLEKRRQGYPIAYITGEKEFWSLSLKVDKHTLIPRPESEHLVERALQLLPSPSAGCQPRILELGTGSGAIAIAIASERPDCMVTATDCSAEAIATACANAARLGLDNIVFRKAEWFCTLCARDYYLVLANPPYLSEQELAMRWWELRHEPRMALDGGSDGMQHLGHIIANAGDFLCTGGWLVLEHGCNQAERVQRLLGRYGREDISTVRDYAGHQRVSCGRYHG